ncbi:TetR/AcrR family transcriptional regulator [Streptomyces muensis]|uniref:TetR/AcrR family transcriptional regulator n=1 Tax=Streptomyces muensis TaxID=1077944 RepID=A0A9X1Q7X6_STRM4|nr:TetR family transcriptional regulator [Streptomyces muensis]MCF1599549.1 TetR/AcrR family transcriptional regulator [Streptomyces muensis]
MEIARAAAALFVKQGLRATRAEDIAQAAGVAPRTFYRYFATKEEAVAPLYTAGATRWTEAVRDAPTELSIPEALEHALHHTLTPGAGVSESSWQWARTLVRLALSSPALSKVWAESCHASERTLAEALATRTGQDNVAALNFAAAVAAAAVRVAVETWASGNAPADGPEGPAALAQANLAALRNFPWTGMGGPE